MKTRIANAASKTDSLTAAQAALLAKVGPKPTKIDGRTARAGRALEKLGLATITPAGDDGFWISAPAPKVEKKNGTPSKAKLDAAPKSVARILVDAGKAEERQAKAEAARAKSGPAAKPGDKKGDKPAKAKKPAKESKAWPSAFPTRASIAERMRTDIKFLYDSIETLQRRTETRVDQTSFGFMLSHRHAMAAHCKKLRDGRELSGDEVKKAREVCVQYARQLARVAREDAVRRDPSLKKIASVFGLAEASA